MLDQIKKIVEQLTTTEVANNASIDSNLASNVAEETGNSLIDGLKSAVSGGNMSDIMGMMSNTDVNTLTSNPVVKNIIESLSSNLGSKFGLDSGTSSNFASSIIPQILSAVLGGVKNGNFNVTDILGSLTGGGSSASGGSILDQNGDGKVGIDDAIAAVKKGGLGDILGGFFKK